LNESLLSPQRERLTATCSKNRMGSNLIYKMI
jgi:hypothetical protein